MKTKEIWRFIKFTLFSISAGVIQFGSFALFNEVIFHDGEFGLSYFLSLALSILWNFTFNFKFTFKAATNVPKAMALAFLFYVFFTPISAFGGNYLTKECGWNNYLVEAIMMVSNFILEFFWSKYVTYRNKIDTKATTE